MRHEWTKGWAGAGTSGHLDRVKQGLPSPPMLRRLRSQAVFAAQVDFDPVVVVLIFGAIFEVVFLPYILTSRGLAPAAMTLVGPCAAIWFLRRPANGLLLAVIVLLIIPYWYAHVWLVAPLFAVVGLAAGVARTRVRVVDAAFGLVLADFVASWALHPELDVGLKVAVEGLIPFGYYVWVRLSVDEEALPRIQWAALLAAGLAACTVIYEAIRGVAAFVDPQVYQWSGSSGAVFRPGGVFGGSPTAATVLSLVLLASVALYQQRPRTFAGVATVIVIAVGLTLDRAGLLALTGGALLLALLLPYRRWRRLALAALAATIPIYAVTSSPSTVASLGRSQVVSQGLIRSDTLSDRVSLAATAMPLLADSRSHFLFGRGFDALEAPGRHDSGLAAAPDLWVTHDGPNDDYLRAMLEQGLTGLVLLLAWLGGACALGVRTSLRLRKGSRQRAQVAGLTSATFGYMLASIGHDFAHNVADLSVAALITGLLVTACTLATNPELQQGGRAPRHG